MEYDSLSLLKYKNLELIKEQAGEIPNAETIANWSNTLGGDRAAFLLYESILASPEQKNFIELVYHQKIGPAPKHPVEIWVISSSNEKLAKWGSHVDVIRTWMQELGRETQELVTFSDNNLLENARLIGEAIQASHNKKIIVSFGRGSLEMSLLAKMNEKNKTHDLHSVASWINIAGSVSGSVWADQILNSRLSQFASKLKSLWRKEYLADLAWASKKNPVWRSGFSSLKHSINITMLPVCFEKHIPVYYKNAFQKLKAFGPNNSQSLLVDQIIRPGLVYPVWRKTLIDEIEAVKQDFIRVVLASETLIFSRLGLDLLKEDSAELYEEQREAPLELEM